MLLKDYTTLQTIPGFKAILKAVITAQIQTLVEQLHTQTGEESLFLTASITDGTICFLGSGTGQGFLQGHQEIKSQFLTHCQKTSQNGTPDMVSTQLCQNNLNITQTNRTQASTTSQAQRQRHLDGNILQTNCMDHVFSIQSNGQHFPLTISNCEPPTHVESSSKQYCTLAPLNSVQHVSDFEHKEIPFVGLQTMFGNDQKGVPVECIQTMFQSEQKGVPVVSMQTLYDNVQKGVPVVSIQTTYDNDPKPVPIVNMQPLYDNEQKQVPVESNQPMYDNKQKRVPAENRNTIYNHEHKQTTVTNIQTIHENQQKGVPEADMQSLLIHNQSTSNAIMSGESESSGLIDIDKQDGDLKDKTKKTLSSKIKEITERIQKDEPQKILEDALQLACITTPEVEVKTKGPSSKSEQQKPRQRKSGKTKDVSRASHRKPKLPRYNIGAASDEDEGSQTDGNSTIDILDLAVGIDDSDSSFAHISLDELRDGVILKENETDIPLVGYICSNADDTGKSVLHNVFNLKPDGEVINVSNKPQESSDVSKVTVLSITKDKSGVKKYKPGSEKSLINKKLWLKCTSCPERFPNQEILQVHMDTVVHSHKKYTCDLCGWKFGQLRDKERHRRIHTGERPFKCDICNKDFARKDNLKLHRRKHSRHTKQLPPAVGTNMTTVLT